MLTMPRIPMDFWCVHGKIPNAFSPLDVEWSILSTNFQQTSVWIANVSMCLEPRFFILDFVSQLWRKFFSKAVRQNQKAWVQVLYYSDACTWYVHTHLLSLSSLRHCSLYLLHHQSLCDLRIWSSEYQEYRIAGNIGSLAPSQAQKNIGGI